MALRFHAVLSPFDSLRSLRASSARRSYEWYWRNTVVLSKVRRSFSVGGRSRRIPLLILFLSTLLLSGCVSLTKHVYDTATHIGRSQLGLVVHKVKLSNQQTISYMESYPRYHPAKGTIVLLHGYAGDKDNWLLLASYLTSQYHLVILDLPGHGSSSSSLNIDYSFTSQADTLHLFTEQLHLAPFHLMGTSMGGGIATMYAVRHPEGLQTLTLIDPAIFNPEEKSQFFSDLAAGKNVLLFRKPGDLDRLIKTVFYKPPHFVFLVGSYVEKRAIDRHELNEKIFNDLLRSKAEFKTQKDTIALLKQLSMPLMVFWGDRDRIFDPADTALIHEARPDATVIILPKVGHAAPAEAPGRIAKDWMRWQRKGN